MQFHFLRIDQGEETLSSLYHGRKIVLLRKCYIPTEYSEQEAELMIGKELTGRIVKIKCAPYILLNQTTGSEIELDFQYAYVHGEKKPYGHTKVNTFLEGVLTISDAQIYVIKKEF